MEGSGRFTDQAGNIQIGFWSKGDYLGEFLETDKCQNDLSSGQNKRNST